MGTGPSSNLQHPVCLTLHAWAKSWHMHCSLAFTRFSHCQDIKKTIKLICNCQRKILISTARVLSLSLSLSSAQQNQPNARPLASYKSDCSHAVKHVYVFPQSDFQQCYESKNNILMACLCYQTFCKLTIVHS